MMKSTFSKNILCFVAAFGGLAHAYLIDPPTTASSDTVQDCSNWVVVSSSDKCLTLADDNGITLAQFQTYNPSVGTSCELVSGNSYCTEQNFGIPPEPTSTSAAPTSSMKPTPTNGISTPTPTQSPFISNCDKFYLVKTGDGCEPIATTNSITLEQFYSWNPAVGQCANLWPTYYVCVGMIGFTPTSKPTAASSTTTTKTTPTNGIVTPTPTQSPFISNCDKFYLVKTGDGCEPIATTNSITLDQFYSWNPAVGQCANLWPTYYVCVGMIGFTPTSKPTVASSTTITTTKTTSMNGIVTPTPTQSPFISNCNRFYQVKSGDGCEPIATANSISLDQFYAWNPAVGQCLNLWPTYFVCVGIIGFTPTSSTKISTIVSSTSTKTTATNGITTPTPTQSGIVGNCDAFYKVVTDDGCAAIASKYGITTAQFYTWNPSIGNTCANLWPDYYVCVSIVGVNPSFATSIKPTSTLKPSSTSTKANGVATPTPVQTGMIATCKKFYKVVTGDGCWGIADTNKITLDNFYKWNAAIKTDCSALWPGYYVCIGI